VNPKRLAATRRALVLVSALTFSLANVASPQSRPNHIRNLDAVLTVRPDGSIDVTEQLTIELTGGSNEVLRDLSLRDDATRTRSNNLNLEILAVTNEDGQPLRTEESSAEEGLMRRIRIWISGTGNGDRHIAIRYRVFNAIHSVNGANKRGTLDEMRWTMLGGTETPIDTVHARVVLPAGARASRAAVYSGPNEAVADAAIRKTGNEVSSVLARGLAAHQAMTLSVDFPSGYILGKPSSSLWARLLPAFAWWPLLLPLIVFLFALRAWNKTGRDPKADSQVVRYEPVEGVSPAGLGRLVTDRRDPQMRLLTATLVDLAVRGFLRIEETTPSILVTLNKDVTAVAQSILHGESAIVDYIIHFVRPRSEWTGLKWHEERLLNGLITAATSAEGTERNLVRVSMLRNKFYLSVPEIAEAIEIELAAKGYYRTRPGRVNLTWITYASFPLMVAAFVGWFFGGILDWSWLQIFDEPVVSESPAQSNDKFVVAMILSTLILIGFAYIMPSRSVAGARARDAALGFKEFLSRVDTMPSVDLFERYLPYAIAFGVHGSWTRAFENIYVAAPTWYSGPVGKFSPTNFGNRISDLCISAASSMSSRPSET
jgi:hypothetical protein